MTDRKFTDDDVIKALECLSGAEIFCRECAFGRLEDHGFACKKNVANAALALINRKKVEIESLKIANEKMYAANKEQEAEIERLEELAAEKQNLTEQWQNKVGELLAEKQIIEAEAIKEFAKKIKTDAERICDDNYIEDALIKYVDTLVKEMTEGKNESQSTKTVE